MASLHEPSEDDELFDIISHPPSEPFDDLSPQVHSDMPTGMTCRHVVATPHLQGILSGVKTVIERCKTALLAAPTLMQHFSEGQRSVNCKLYLPVCISFNLVCLHIYAYEYMRGIVY